MARIKSVTTSTGNGASVAVTDVSHAIGDLLCLFASNDGGGTSLGVSGTGWAKLGTDAASAGSRSAWFYKIATGTSGEGPTVSGAADDWAFSYYVIEGATATPFGASPADGTDYKRTDYDITSVKGAITIASGALTTLTDNGLALIGINIDTGTATLGIKPNPDDYTLDSTIVINSGGVSHVTGHLQLGAAGSTPALVSYSNTQEGGNAWIIHIRDSGAGLIQRDCRAGGEISKWHGDFGSALESLTYSSPKTNFDTTTNKIDGLDCSTTTPTASTLADALAAPGSLTSIADATNGVADVWAGASWAVSSLNLTGAVESLRWQLSSTSTPLGSKGVLLLFGSGSTMTTNWVAYQLVANPSTLAGLSASTNYMSEIALGAATEFASSGTVDWSAVTRVGFVYHRVAGSATSRTIYIRNQVDHKTAKLIGGSEAYPVQISLLCDTLKANGVPFVATKQGAGQSLLKSAVQIGDGSIPTYFKCEAQSLEYPLPWLLTDIGQMEWNANASSVGVTVYASASDTIDFSAGVLATSVKQPFTLHASTSGSATYRWTGFSLVGYDPTWATAVDCSGMTFANCDTVKFKGASVTGVTIKNLHDDVGTTDAAASWDTSGATVTSTTIDVTGSSAGYHIELGTSVTAITLADVTFTGTPGTDKVHVLKTSGTVTITISGTTTLSLSDVTSAGATVVIAAPQPTLDATVLADTRVVLYNRTTDAELDNTFVTGTSWSFVVTSGASTADVLDLYTFKEGYEESVATIIYSGDDATFAVEQAVDDAIDYYRTTESITDYTALTEFDFYSPDIYIQSDDADGVTSLKRLFIFYNGALTTEDGARYMRGGVTFRSPFDVVINRSVVAMAVDNVSTTLGLYFSDEGTIRVTTDDGSSWIAPPSAPGSIRYAFGVAPGQVQVGGSPMTTEDRDTILAAIPSAATIASEVVSGVTFP